MKLHPSNTLRGRKIQARDGDIGECVDFLFDDLDRTIRYLVADTRKWLPGRRVVLSPSEVGEGRLPTADGGVKVDLTREQIRESPPLDEHAPVSMQVEERLSAYYGWPVYWAGADPWGDSSAIPTLRARQIGGPPQQTETLPDVTDPQTSSWLRSMREVCDYRIETPDGELGHIEDFLFETTGWSIPYFIVDTRTWWPGRKLAVPQHWFDGFDAVERTAQVRRTRGEIEECPEVDPHRLLDASEMERIHAHFVQGFARSTRS